MVNLSSSYVVNSTTQCLNIFPCTIHLQGNAHLHKFEFWGSYHCRRITAHNQFCKTSSCSFDKKVLYFQCWHGVIFGCLSLTSFLEMRSLCSRSSVCPFVCPSLSSASMAGHSWHLDSETSSFQRCSQNTQT